jgi:DNA-binding NarL/FixJ family response regulator
LIRLKNDLSKQTESNAEEEFVKNIKKTVRTISGEMKSTSAWEQFREQFIKIYPGFIERISNKYPELTTKDLKICSYHRMNLDTKEIAALTSLTVRTIQTSRFRLRQKMKIPKEIPFQEFINQI